MHCCPLSGVDTAVIINRSLPDLWERVANIGILKSNESDHPAKRCTGCHLSLMEIPYPVSQAVLAFQDLHESPSFFKLMTTLA